MIEVRQQVCTLLLTLLLAGCTAATPHESSPMVAEQTAPTTVPLVRTQAVNQGSTSTLPPPSDTWNDQALLLIQQGDWAGAIAAAQEALTLDPESAAGWFNLGRGYLGSGQATLAVHALEKAHERSLAPNADVEYFLGQAQTKAQRVIAARLTYERALQIWPTDRAIGQALQTLKVDHDTETITDGRIDVDGDGSVDMIADAKGEVRVISGSTGEVLHIEHSPFSGMKELDALVTAYPFHGSNPLVRVSWNACPMGFNTFFWYDRQQKTFRLADGGGLCLGVSYQGDGRFEFILPEGNALLVNTQRWDTDHWVEEGREERPRQK